MNNEQSKMMIFSQELRIPTKLKEEYQIAEDAVHASCLMLDKFLGDEFTNPNLIEDEWVSLSDLLDEYIAVYRKCDNFFFNYVDGYIARGEFEFYESQTSMLSDIFNTFFIEVEEVEVKFLEWKRTGKVSDITQQIDDHVSFQTHDAVSVMHQDVIEYNFVAINYSNVMVNKMIKRTHSLVY